MNRSFTTAAGHQKNPSVAEPAQAGYTITVWEDDRYGATHIFAQKIDNATGTTLWKLDDFGASATATNNQRNPRAAYDSLGGVIITWEDYRYDPTNTYSCIYANRIDVETGERSAGWERSGNPVGNPGGDGVTCLRPRIAGTADGAFIAWYDNRRNPPDRDVYTQYVKYDGTMLWTTDGVLINTDQALENDQINPELALDFDWNQSDPAKRGGVIIAFLDNRYTSPTTSLPVWNVFLTRLNCDGDAQYQNGIVRAAGVSEEQINHVLRTSGKGACTPGPLAIVCWQDAREDPDSPLYDIWAQAVDLTGNLLNNNDNGVEICLKEGSTQIEPVMTLWERPSIEGVQEYAPLAYIAWRDSRDELPGVYGSLMDASERMPGTYPWLAQPVDLEGIPIATAPDVPRTQLAIDNLGLQTSANAFVAWRQENGEIDIYHQSIEIQSFANEYVPTWSLWHSVYGKRLTEAKGEQCLPQVSGNVFVWQDARRQPIPNDAQNDWNIYCESLGACIEPQEIAWRDTYVRWWGGTDAKNLRYVTDPGDGSMFIVWDEIREGENRVFIQKLDKDGVPRWKSNGVLVSVNDIGTAAEKADVALLTGPNGSTGAAWVVWQQGAPGSRNVYWRMVAANGAANPIIHSVPIMVNVECYEPQVIDKTGSSGNIIMAMLVGLIGGPTVPGICSTDQAAPITPDFQMSSAVLQHVDLRISKDYLGGCYVMTHGSAAGNERISVLHATLGGGGWTGTPNDLITYQSASDFYGYDMCTDVIDPGGSPHDLMVAYSITPPAGVPELFVQRFGSNTTDLFPAALTPPEGYLPFNIPGVPSQPCIVPDSVALPATGLGGCLVAWNQNQYIAQYGGNRNAVLTNQAEWTNNPPAPPTLFPWSRVSGYSVEPTFPDIAAQTRYSPGVEPRSFIVWEGEGESSPCGPPRAKDIWTQYSEYDGQSGSQTLWQQEELVSPGGGNYFQRSPIVQTSVGHSVSVYWLDDRNANDGIIGTRLSEQGGGIAWYKRRDVATKATVPSQLAIEPVHPNPVRLSGNGRASFEVSLPEDGTIEIHLTDMLGRTIAIPYSGFAGVGRHAMSIALPPSATTGTYFIQIHSGGRFAVRPFAVIR